MTSPQTMQLEATYLDAENPHSLLSRVWVELVPYLQQVSDVYAPQLLWHETKLKAYANPDERDQRVRLNFWDEYSVATAENRMMQKWNVIHGAVSSEVWSRVYLTDRKKLLWVFCQPSSYTSSMRMLLDKGISRLQEIMELPILSKNGAPDVRVINQVLKAFQLVDLRVKGAVVQRMQIDQRNLNVNMDGDKQPSIDYSAMSMEQLEQIESQLDRISAKKEKAVLSLSPAERSKIYAESEISVPLEIDVTPLGKRVSYDEKADAREQVAFHDATEKVDDETEKE